MAHRVGGQEIMGEQLLPTNGSRKHKWPKGGVGEEHMLETTGRVED